MERSEVIYIFVLTSLLLLNACTVVHYQGIAQSSDGSLNVSGQETRFMSSPRAVVLQCNVDGDKDYVCNQHYPADSVDLFANASATRN